MNRFLNSFNRLRPFLSNRCGVHFSTFQCKVDAYHFCRKLSRGRGILKNKVPILSASSRRDFSSRHSKKNLYKILGVSPKATQAQIKTAYYDMSLKHHPDRHKGSQKALEKFQEISEAYSVLGSLDSRKQYDRALIVEGILSPEQARPFRAPMRPSASTYNFDEWTRKHYFEALVRTQRGKRERRSQEKEKHHGLKVETFRSICIVLFLFICAFVLGIQNFHEKDKNEYS